MHPHNDTRAAVDCRLLACSRSPRTALHPQNCHLLYNWTLVNSTVYDVDYFAAPPPPPLAAGPASGPTGGVHAHARATTIFSDPSVLAPTLTLPVPGTWREWA